MDRYTVISADCHGGAQLEEYRAYLPARYLEDFDDWARDYAIPFEDLRGPDADRNWDHQRRVAEMDADGVVAEVIFPNTIPPFFPSASLLAQPVPTAEELAARWAGLQAHNRWLADFCGRLPGRRAGVAQIMLHDVGAAVAEIRWAVQAGLTGGILLPGAPPGSGLAPLYSPAYEPIWSVCEELGVPINHHSGSAVPVMGDDTLGEHGEALAHVMFMLEVTWWAHRTLWHLIFSGVMQRHPSLQFVFTEQGTGWIPETLATLDYFADRMARAGGSQEHEWGASIVGRLELTPSEYWARQCHVGSSFLRPAECELRYQVGVDRIMWGSDYPHLEGSHPFSREAQRLTFSGVDPKEVAAMLGGNAAAVYGFDLDRLAPLAARLGPTVAEVATPLDHIPPGAERCPAFAGAAPTSTPSATPPDRHDQGDRMSNVRYGARLQTAQRNREVEATSVQVWAEVVTAIYETDADVVKAVLPPPLEPGDPLVRITIATVAVEGRPPFGAGYFAVRARHEGVDGEYPLVMPMTTEQAVIGGRETFGEPKKIGEVTLVRNGAAVVGAMGRLGVTFAEIRGQVVETLPLPPERTKTDFYFKFLPAPDGKGFDSEPALVYCYRKEVTRRHERVEGEVILRESSFDPVIDLPVRRLVEVTFSERSSQQWAEIHSHVPGEWIQPFVHQRYDDLSPVGTK